MAPTHYRRLFDNNGVCDLKDVHKVMWSSLCEISDRKWDSLISTFLVNLILRIKIGYMERLYTSCFEQQMETYLDTRVDKCYCKCFHIL